MGSSSWWQPCTLSSYSWCLEISSHFPLLLSLRMSAVSFLGLPSILANLCILQGNQNALAVFNLLEKSLQQFWHTLILKSAFKTFCQPTSSCAVKIRPLGRREVYKCVPQVCLIGDGFPTKVIVQGTEGVIICWRKFWEVSQWHIVPSQVALWYLCPHVTHEAWHCHGGTVHTCE